MLKKLFKFLALFAFLSLACFVLLMLYSKDSTVFFTKPYHVANGNDTLSWVINESVQQLWAKLLGPCPDTPPNLFSPLTVDFNSKWTLDEVTQEVSSPLQEGGKYKPPDCISQHKVGECM